MKKFLIFLNIVFILTRLAYAQDTTGQGEKDIKLLQKETRTNKIFPVENGVGVKIKEDSKAQFNKVGGEIKQAKNNVQTAVKKFKGPGSGKTKELNKTNAEAKKYPKAPTQPGEARSDSASRKQNEIVKELKKDIKNEKDKAANNVKSVKSPVKSSANLVKQPKEFKPKENDIEELKKDAEKKGKNLTRESVKNAKAKEAKEIDNLKNGGNELKANIKQKTQELKSKVPDTTNAKAISRKVSDKMMEDKISKMQYSSDDPQNAPWKKKIISKDDIKDLKKPSSTKGFFSPKEGSPGKYGEKLKNKKALDISKEMTSGIPDKVNKDLKPDKLSKFQDSISVLSNQFNKLGIDNIKQDLSGSKKIYSDKYIKMLSDSLGIGKADSILKIAKVFAKTETSEEELLGRINSSIDGKDLHGAKLEASEKDATQKEADKIKSFETDYTNTNLSGLQKGDLSDLKLPQSVLSELPPLSSMELDSKYLRMVDSLKNLTLKENGYSMEDRKIDENIKQFALKKKPTFINKSYFEGIIGYARDSTVNIIRLSPALGYRYTDFFSLGLGPNFLLQLQGKKVNIQSGLRPFIKGEFWKQRAYLKLEDNIQSTKIKSELDKNSIVHEMLGGGGLVLPISSSLGINFQLLYRLNKLTNSPNQSPWVFRVGLSTIKKLK